MEWFFFESMWTPVIAGILVGSCAFALDGIDNFSVQYCLYLRRQSAE